MPSRPHTPCRHLLPLVCLTLAACGNDTVTGPTPRSHSCVPSFTLQPSPAAVQQFCLAYESTLCTRAFADCGAALSTAHTVSRATGEKSRLMRLRATGCEWAESVVL
jgi:hypothetical protein